MWSHSQTHVHQLVQLWAAALVQVSAAGVASVHQVAQLSDGVVRGRVAHGLKLQDTRSLAVHVPGTLVQFKISRWGKNRRATFWLWGRL